MDRAERGCPKGIGFGQAHLIGAPIAFWSVAGTDRKVPLFERQQPTFKGQSSHELEEETGLIRLKLAYAFQFVGASRLHQVFVADVPTQSDPRPGKEINLCQWFRYVDVQSLPTSTPMPKIVERLYDHSCANVTDSLAIGI
ncbi:hypothetical protein WS78_13665 [Burkholderia savannae]|nr:hypothetical protein WS78_13665 [Burkholderia savannae]